MGYNGPAPGDRWNGKTLVHTVIVRNTMRKAVALSNIPKPGSIHPVHGQYIAGRPTRVEDIRVDVWSIDIPYRRYDEIDFAEMGFPAKSYDLAPNLPAWQVLAVVLAILFAVAWLCPTRAWN